MSRPPILKITKALLDKVGQMASRGLTNEQIACCLGVSETTVYKNKRNSPQFAQAIKNGQAKGVKDISNALFDKAAGGDTIAQIFYLKNRSPEEWKDRKEIKQEINQTVSIDTNQLADEVMQSIVKDERTRREEEASLH
jgi:predicted transcriptional regulator